MLFFCLFCQDPNTIEHQAVPSGDLYAVVDKPKKGSKKNKGGPDVVPPPGDEGVSVWRGGYCYLCTATIFETL